MTGRRVSWRSVVLWLVLCTALGLVLGQLLLFAVQIGALP